MGPKGRPAVRGTRGADGRGHPHTGHFGIAVGLTPQLPRLLASGPAPAPVVTQACRRLSETSGSMSIGALAGELGTSRRYLEMRFGEQVGLPPKTVARIVRFRRALNQLIGRTRRPLALVASGCGYSDQAHFSREFRSLAGCTQAAFRAESSAANTSTAIG